MQTIACGTSVSLPSVAHGAETALEQSCSTYMDSITEQRPDGNVTYGTLDLSNMYFDEDKYDDLRSASETGEVGKVIVQLVKGDKVVNYGLDGWVSEVPAAEISNEGNSTMGVSWQPTKGMVRLNDGEIPKSLFCGNVTAEAITPKKSRAN